MRTVEAIFSRPWAILPENLETIVKIASREHDAEALQAKLGKPLEYTRSVTMRGDTAIIPIHGSIFRYANIFTEISGATSTEVLARDISEAADNPSVSNIVLEINSGGGQADGISDLAALIRKTAQLPDKRVVAYVEGIGASAAYWIASAANHIVASKASMVGSIGVVFTLTKGEDDERLEIVSSVSPKKRPDVSTAEGRSQIQRWADRLGEVFLSDVAENRGVSYEEAFDLFGQGDMLIASEALERGMIDEIGTLEGLLETI